MGTLSMQGGSPMFRRPSVLGVWVAVACSLVLTGCPSKPVPPVKDAQPRPAETSGDHPAPSQADCTRLLELKNRAVGALENERFPEALAALDELNQLLPENRLVVRNRAVARLMGLKSGIATSEQAQAALDDLTRVDRTPEGHWLAGRLQVALAERLTDPPARDAALMPGMAALEQASQALLQNAAVAYEIYEAGRYAAAAEVQAQARKALMTAGERAPDNLYLLTELLALRAELQQPEVRDTINRIREIAGPLREGILRRTRVKLDDLLDGAATAVDKSDWRTLLVRSRQLSAVIRPEDRAQSDRRELSPHSLEFVVFDFDDGLCVSISSGSAVVPVAFSDVPATFDLPATDAVVAATLVDFDLDGRLDLLVATATELRLLQSNANLETWTTRGRWPVSQPVTKIVAVDLDRDATESGMPPAANVCQDADPDVILYGPNGVVVLKNELQADGSRQLSPVELADGLAQAPQVRALIPGDFDHDGDLDLALLSERGFELWMQTSALQFATGTDRVQWNTPQGTVRQLNAVDWDRDLDLDIVATGDGVAGYLENLRHGEFRWREFPFSLPPSIVGQAVIELDGNVSWDLAAAHAGGVRTALTLTPDRGSNVFLKSVETASVAPMHLLSGDWNNDGWIDLAATTSDGLIAYLGQANHSFVPQSIALPASAGDQLLAGDLDGDGALDWVTIHQGTLQIRRNDTAGGRWIDVRVRGAEDPQSGRVNQYGIGSLVEARSAGHYQARVIDGQVTHFGLGSARADTVRVLWTNGVPQVVLQPEENTAICERLALKGSCPYAYVWNGERFEFFTDLLWAAPLGLQFAEGVVAPGRPWEYLLLPGDRVQPRHGHYELRVTEELWEAAYFDQIELLAVDHPADVEVFSNEKVGPPDLAEFRVHTVKNRRRPWAARDQRGRDVLDQVATEDGVYLKAFDQELRQGLTEPHFLELDLGDLRGAERITLFLTGWIYPTDTALNVAISQDPTLTGPKPPALWVPDAAGQWQEVRPFMGFPGGKTKTIAVDLSAVFLTDDYRVRIATSHEIYWDAAFFTVDESPAETQIQSLSLQTADLRYRGFSAALLPEPNAPESYDYERVSPVPKWPPMGGRFTRYGDVRELLQRTDDLLVVLASGDEIALTFAIPERPLPAGWKRDFLLHNVGWDKDADLHTIYGQTVEPLPFQSMPAYPWDPSIEPPSSPEYRTYLERYQSRTDPGLRFWRGP